MFKKSDEKNEEHSLNPISWYVSLTIISLAGSLLIAGILWVTLVGTNFFILDANSQIPTSFGILLAIWIVTFLYLISPEMGGGFTVPGTRKAVLVSWLGMPTPFLLTSGEYKWTGKKLGFGKISVIFGEDKGGFTDSDGNAIMGPITFSVWNTGHSTESNRSTILAPARNRADISANLNFILQIDRLRTVFDQEDPAQDIGDRGRQEFREFVSYFVDTDIPPLAHVATYVLTGQELVTCFIPEDIDAYKAGSMIRDRGGKAMFKLIDPKPKNKHAVRDWEDKRKKEINIFTDKVLKDALPVLLKSVLKEGEQPGTKEIAIDCVKVEHPIDDVVKAVGMKLLRTTLADVKFSDPVTAAANQASAEADERISQIASAKTNKAARAAMLPDEEELKNPAWETAMLIQAAQDDKNQSIKIVVVPGGDKLTKAAIAGGSQIGGK